MTVGRMEERKHSDVTSGLYSKSRCEGGREGGSPGGKSRKCLIPDIWIYLSKKWSQGKAGQEKGHVVIAIVVTRSDATSHPKPKID